MLFECKERSWIIFFHTISTFVKHTRTPTQIRAALIIIENRTFNFETPSPIVRVYHKYLSFN